MSDAEQQLIVEKSTWRYRFTAAQWLEMKREYEQDGRSIRDLAAQYGCGYTSMHYYLSRVKTNMRTRGGMRSRGKK